jgi:hypothetical protein
MDARSAPGRILRSHAQDQVPQVTTDGRSPFPMMVGRPFRARRESQVQYLRKPVRCHWTTVSGFPKASVSDHVDHHRDLGSSRRLGRLRRSADAARCGRERRVAAGAPSSQAGDLRAVGTGPQRHGQGLCASRPRLPGDGGQPAAHRCCARSCSTPWHAPHDGLRAYRSQP